MTSGLSRNELAARLDGPLTLVDEATAAAGIPASARAAARARAAAFFEACAAADDAAPLVQLVYAAELLSQVAVDLAANPAETRHLVGELERRAGVPAIALGREILQAGSLLELPAKIAIEVRLALLGAFIGAASVALWTLNSEGQLVLISHAGHPGADPADQREARRLLEIDTPPPEDGGVIGARIERLRPPPAALVAAAVTGSRARAALLVQTATPVLAALLDRESLTARGGSLTAPEQAAHEGMVSSVERRLARLRFDLHDGPQQDVHLLAQDLSLFREQVRPMVAEDPNAGRLFGRLDDLEAQLVALDGDLRRLSSAVQSPFLAAGSLPEALRQLTDAFAARTGLEPRTEISGALAELTDSQQITLLALVREALSNIRKHSNAQEVTIRVAADAAGIRAEIRDDGDGFDPEEMLLRAARAGRLGLVGMHERVRMLGGRTHIESQPGGPTVISAVVPPWPRVEAEADAPGGWPD